MADADLKFKIVAENLTQATLNNVKENIKQTAKEIRGLNKETESTTSAVNKSANAFTNLGRALSFSMQTIAGFAGITAGLGILTRQIINTTANFERLKLSLKAVEGSSEATKIALQKLEEVAKLPSLNLEQAIQGYVNLRSIGMDAELASRSLMAFANALATIGKGAETMQFVILALTQMSAKGKVMGQDLRQLQEHLPMVRRVMKEAFGTADVEALQKQMEATGKTADDFIKTLVTEFEKMPKVAGGLANSMENLDMAIRKLKASFGEAMIPVLSKFMNNLADLLEKLTKINPAVRDAVSGLLLGATAMSAFLTVLPLLTKGFMQLIGVLVKLKPLLTSLFGVMASHPIAVLATSILVLSGVAYKLIKSFKDKKESVEEANKAFSKYQESISKYDKINELTKKINDLRSKTQLTSDETKELTNSQNELARIAPVTISHFDKLGNAIIKTGEELNKATLYYKNFAEANRKMFLDISDKALVGYYQKLRELRTEVAKLEQEAKEADTKKATKILEKALEKQTQIESLRKNILDLEMQRAKAKNLLPAEQVPEKAGRELTRTEEIIQAEYDLLKTRAEAIFEEFEKKRIMAGLEYENTVEIINLQRKALKEEDVEQRRILDLRLQQASEKYKQTMQNIEKEIMDTKYKLYFDYLEKVQQLELQQGEYTELTKQEKMLEARHKIQLALLDLEFYDPTKKEVVQTEIYMQRLNQLNDLYQKEHEVINKLRIEKKQESERELADIKRITNTNDQYLKRQVEAHKNYINTIRPLMEQLRYTENTTERQIIENQIKVAQLKHKRTMEEIGTDLTRQAPFSDQYLKQQIEAHKDYINTVRPLIEQLRYTENTIERQTIENQIKFAQLKYKKIMEEIETAKQSYLSETDLTRQIAFIESQELSELEKRINITLLQISSYEKLKDIYKDDEAKSKEIEINLMRAKNELSNLYQSGIEKIKNAEINLQNLMLEANKTSVLEQKRLLSEIELRTELEQLYKEIPSREGEEYQLRYQAILQKYTNAINSINASIIESQEDVMTLIDELKIYSASIAQEIEKKLVMPLREGETEEDRLNAIKRMVEAELKILKSGQEQKKLQQQELEDATLRFYNIQKENAEKMYRFTQDVLRPISQIPSDIFKNIMSMYDLEDRARENLLNISRETETEIERIRQSSTMNAYQKAQEIERIERESATRRREIERDLARQKKEIWKSYVKDFLKELFTKLVLQQLENFLLQKMSYAITKSFGVKTEALPVEQTIFDFMFGRALSIFTGGLSDVFKFGADSLMYVPSSEPILKPIPAIFDNPSNDAIMYRLGQSRATYLFGLQSVTDMLKNYEAGKQNSNLQDNRVVIEIDGKQLYGVIKRREEKTKLNNFAY